MCSVEAEHDVSKLRVRARVASWDAILWSKVVKQRKLGRTATNRRVVADRIEDLLEYPNPKWKVAGTPALVSTGHLTLRPRPRICRFQGHAHPTTTVPLYEFSSPAHYQRQHDY